MTTIDRVTSVRAGMGAGLTDAEIEAALVDGYADALAADGWLAELAQRAHAVVDDPSPASAGTVLHELARERRAVERHLVQLRQELASLREERQHARVTS